MKHRLLESLTPAQCDAVRHVDGPLLILAGPGSGKTRVVTHRIAWMLEHGVPPRSILALTFTNKAAAEMQQRVEALAPGKPVWISTFHRFCARLLRQYAALVGLEENFTIYDAGDNQRALKRVLQAIEQETTHFTPQQLAAHISWAKNNLITAEEYHARSGHALGSIVQRVYPHYQQALLRANAVDFDDLLLHVVSLLKNNPELRATLDARFRYIMVDEYQDTNLAQYGIVRALSLDHANLAVTGDPDQSIYGWRGANLTNILEFENDYPDVKVVRLEQNYRSTPSILRAAARLIAHNRLRKEKGLFTENEEGRPVRFVRYENQHMEADGIASQIASEVHSGRRRPRDFAVFYRTNALSRTLEISLRELGVPYQVVSGVEFFQREEIKDVLAYLTLINNPRDDLALLRIINKPRRGIGSSSIKKMSNQAVLGGEPLLDICRRSALVPGMPTRTATAVARFVATIDHLGSLAHGAVEEVLGHVLAESGYQQMLRDSGNEEDQERLANIEELLTAAREFDERNPGVGHLEQFLEEVCLVNETDDWESADDRVTLMTLHASKGLEFPAVYIVALEEGLLPHERSKEDAAQLEEERRLLFVGITRAQQELQLSQAKYRDFRGQRRMTVPSQFLMELPLDEMEMLTPALAVDELASDAQHGDAYEPEHDEQWDADDSWDIEQLESEPATEQPSPPELPKSAAAGRFAGISLKTAAELAGDEPRPAAPPELFHQDMVVMHPEYGLGRIVALSGSGVKRTATVDFGAGGQKKFVLLHSPLRPVKQG